VDPKDIIGFAADRTSYEVGVADTVTVATVAATANHDAATFEISPVDAVDGTLGHQVNLSAGVNTVTITVTAEDNTTTEYTVNINRGVTDDYGWKASDDYDALTAADNLDPYGICAADSVMLVADFSEDKLYAYSLQSGAHQTGDDITLHTDNDRARGVWCDDSGNMWVVNNAIGTNTDNVFTYPSGGTGSLAFSLRSESTTPSGIWSDGDTVWVSDFERHEAFSDRAVVKGHRLVLVAAST